MHKGSILPLSLLLLAHVPLQKWFGIVHLKKKKRYEYRLQLWASAMLSTGLLKHLKESKMQRCANGVT